MVVNNPWLGSAPELEPGQEDERSSFLHGASAGFAARHGTLNAGTRSGIAAQATAALPINASSGYWAPTARRVLSSTHGDVHRAESGASSGRSAPDGAGERGSRVFGRTRKQSLLDEDDEETFFERLSNSPPVLRLSALADRVFQNYFVAILMDVVGVLLFMFDIYTDALVVDALSQTEHTDWMLTTLAFILWHYVIMAVLVAAYLKRTTTKLNVLGLEEGDSALGGAAVLGSGRRHRWLLFVPVAVPGVVLLDIAMLFTSILPLLFPHLFVNFSSFLSNYNFSRFFIEFVFESIPQTILQTYIYHQLAQSKLAGSDQQRTVAMSLTVSSLNCLKYGWKLYKAADDAGLTLPEYFKYLLLLKGNYECSPSAMIAVINECCSERKDTTSGTAAAAAASGATLANGSFIGGGAAAAAVAGSNGMVFIMNGFHLHRNKSQYGPAQQAYILLNAFDRIDGCSGVHRWVVSGCPLASINRILEKGIRAFKNLQTLEVNECALRGDTWKLVTRAIKRHKRLEKVKLIQTGILTKYRNAKRMRVVTGVFKHSLNLRTVALCLNWWDEDYLQSAVDLYLLDHPTLESLAIELPPGAEFASRALGATDPRVAVDGRRRGRPSHIAVGCRASGGAGWGLGGRRGVDGGPGGLGMGASKGRLGGGQGLAAPPAAALGPHGRLYEAAEGKLPNARMPAAAGAGGSTSRGRAAFGVSGAAAGFLSPFAADAGAAAGGGGGGGGSGGGGVSGALRGLVQQGGGMLYGIASYVSDGAVSTFQGLTAVATGQPWSSGSATAAATAGVASPRYCWLLANVVASAPALRALYIHNHALPEGAAEGVGQLAAALAGNTRLTALSLRGSSVGDAGAAALARVLAAHNSCLQVLNLRRCQLHDEGISALCNCLVENRGLRSLDLSYNRVQGQGQAGRLAGLERALRLNTRLEELRLEGWRDTFDDDQVAAPLAAALATNEGLRTLSLAGCCLDSHAAANLAAAIAANTCLTALDLSAGGASSEGARDAVVAGGGGSGPEGGIGDAGVAALATALVRNRGLRELNLAGSRCGELAGAALLEALRVNSMLQVLDLSGDGGGGGDAGISGGGWGGCGGDGGRVGAATTTRGDEAGEEAEEEEGAPLYERAATGLNGVAAAAAATTTGVDDAAATCIFTALQTNSGLRVLRLRGAIGLTHRSMRAAAEMLRRNSCLWELDLSNSTFLAAVDATSAATNMTSTATSSAGTAGDGNPLSQHALAQLPRPASLRSMASLTSSLPSHGSLQALQQQQQQHHHHHPPGPNHRHEQHLGQPRQSLTQGASRPATEPSTPRGAGAAAAAAAAAAGTCTTAAAAALLLPPPPLRRPGSAACLLGQVQPAPDLLPSVASVGGLGGEAELSEEARQVVGALWSALAGGLATNTRLRVLRLGHCGVGAVGAAALAPALMQNTALQELDLSGLPASTARTQLAAVIARAAAHIAAAAAQDAAAQGAYAANLSNTAFARPGSATVAALAAAAGVRDCCLVSLKATDEAYEAVDLLGAGRVTSRAAEEAAAALEEARRAPRRGWGWGRVGAGGGEVAETAGCGSLLGDEDRGGSGGGVGEGPWWRRWG